MGNIHIHGSLTYTSPARLRGALEAFEQHAATECVDTTHWTVAGKIATIDHRCEVPADMGEGFHHAFVEASRTAKSGLVTLERGRIAGRIYPKGHFVRVGSRTPGRLTSLSCRDVMHDYRINPGRRGVARVPADGPPEGTGIVGGSPLLFSCFASHGAHLAVAVTPKGAPKYTPTAPDILKPSFAGPTNFSIVLYNTDSGAELWRVFPAKYTLNAMAFSAEGDTLAAVSTDNNLYLLDPTTGASRSIKTGYKGGGQHVAFSPDGEKVATIGEPKRKGFRYKREPILRVWQVSDGTLLYDKAAPFQPQSLAFSADGTCLLTGPDRKPVRMKRGGSPKPGPEAVVDWEKEAPALLRRRS